MDETALRAVFDLVAMPQVVLDRESVVRMATQDFLRAIDAEREGVIGRSVFELPPYAHCEEARRELTAALQISLRSGVRHSVRLDPSAPLPGGTHFSRATVTPVTDSAGEVTYLVHSFELVLPASSGASSDRERRLRKMIEDSYETIALVDARGMFTFVAGVERVLGYSEQEWLSKPALAGIHPDDLPRFGALINEMFARAGSRFVTRVRHLHKDGSYRTLDASAVNRLDDADIAGVVITFRDLSEQIAMQEDVRRSEERLRIALSAARALCWDLDLVHDRHIYSEDYGAYYRLPPGSYHGQDSLQAVHPDDRALILEAAGRARESEGVFSAEFRGLPRSERTRWYASHGKVLRDAQGNAVRMLGVTWDISERRQLQEERRLLEERLQQGQKLESLGVLAGGIAHDFNNLLMVVLGNASLLESLCPMNGDGRRCLQQIEEATRRASDLCHQLLAYAGKGQFVLSSVDLNALIESTTHLLQVSISKKAVLRFDLSSSLPLTCADATQLRQVLMNLVINASDAIADRSGVIAIRTGVMRADRGYLDQTLLATELAPGEFVFVEVSDTGAGMSEETLSHIFEPFFSTKFPGRGLGLAAVLGIVRGHHGALRVHSSIGKGSTFRLLLPIHEATTAPQSPRAADKPFVGDGMILLVDDEETVRAVAGRMLESLGFRVLTARDGRDALAVYRERASELTAVVMDMTMPHVDGEEAVRELRRMHPQLRVLMISGYNRPESMSRIASPGLTAFLQKPFDREDLESALRALLHG